jgi:hypothetical protein
MCDVEIGSFIGYFAYVFIMQNCAYLGLQGLLSVYIAHRRRREIYFDTSDQAQLPACVSVTQSKFKGSPCGPMSVRHQASCAHVVCGHFDN